MSALCDNGQLWTVALYLIIIRVDFWFHGLVWSVTICISLRHSSYAISDLRWLIQIFDHCRFDSSVSLTEPQQCEVVSLSKPSVRFINMTHCVHAKHIRLQAISFCRKLFQYDSCPWPLTLSSEPQGMDALLHYISIFCIGRDCALASNAKIVRITVCVSQSVYSKALRHLGLSYWAQFLRGQVSSSSSSCCDYSENLARKCNVHVYCT